MTEITQHTTFVNEVAVHYLKAGQGDPIVLLHGWLQTSHEWCKVMPKLAERYIAIAPDLPGLGDFEPLNRYDKKTVAESISQLVRQLGFARIYLVAHDMGVPVAYAYASLYPEIIDRLVILDVPPPNPTSQSALWHIAFHRIPELPEALIHGREEIYMRYFYGDAYPQAISEDDVREYVRCYSNPASFKASLDYYRAFPQNVQDNIEFAKTPLKMPVLVLHGEQSPLGNSAFEVMKTLATDVRGNAIANCGHWIAEEQPEALLDSLLSFFAEGQALITSVI